MLSLYLSVSFPHLFIMSTMTELIDDGRLEMARREIQHDKDESKHLIKLNSVARVETDF